MRPGQRTALAGAALWAVLAVPAVRHPLESTMTYQMLVQLPLLGAAGWALAQGVPAAIDRRLALWDQSGISGLLLASLAGLAWMLPRAMDASVDEPWVALAKFLSVPLLIGAPVALSWPRAGFVVRGIVLAEVIAMTLRLGWLYLISPQRLCSNYLLGDQQRLGRILIIVGLAILLAVAWKLMWGHSGTGRATGEGSSDARR
ncbi:MAG TPA: hypothetical protein VK991_02820 [Halomonas sp.]|nr:hypothetical protein [Halomonas sp.]